MKSTLVLYLFRYGTALSYNSLYDALYKARYGDSPAPKNFLELGNALNKLITNKDCNENHTLEELNVMEYYLSRMAYDDGKTALLFGCLDLLKMSTTLYCDIGVKVNISNNLLNNKTNKLIK